MYLKVEKDKYHIGGFEVKNLLTFNSVQGPQYNILFVCVCVCGGGGGEEGGVRGGGGRSGQNLFINSPALVIPHCLT